MEVFPLRPLCLSLRSLRLMAFQRRGPQRYAETAEKTNQLCHLCKAVPFPGTDPCGVFVASTNPSHLEVAQISLTPLQSTHLWLA